MKKLSYLLLFVIVFFACENVDENINKNAQNAMETAAEQIEKTSKEAPATAEEEVVYKFKAEKGEFELNDNFHVMASSGLRMRVTPELKGETILTIPYDGVAERVDENDYGVLEVEEIKGFKVKGNWIKVRYDGKEGYVFDGFLTKFPLPEAITYSEYDYRKYKSSFDYYFRTKVGGTSGIYDIEKYGDCESELENDCLCAYTQDFGPIKYSTTNCSETGGDYKMEIETLSLTEAYFIIKALNLNNINSDDGNQELFETITYDKTSKQINFEADGAGCYTGIKKDANGVIKIDIYCGC